MLSEAADTTHLPEQPAPRSSWDRQELPCALIFILVAVRAASELAMMYAHGSDPQMPIWLMYMAVELVLWFLAGAALAGLLILLWRRRWGFRVMSVLLVAWSVAIGAKSWDSLRGCQALADAASPLTSDDKLLELVHFTGYRVGGELEVRIANNRNASPETLRELYSRDPQEVPWTLARNPKTPEDVLLELAKRPNKWIRESLLENPALPKSARDELVRVHDGTRPRNVQSKEIR